MKRPSEYTFAAVFEKEADGRYSVSFPQLEGCFTEGDTFEDARRMAVDAMSLHCTAWNRTGKPSRKPIWSFKRREALLCRLRRG